MAVPNEPYKCADSYEGKYSTILEIKKYYYSTT
jgi:hypothetical protein